MKACGSSLVCRCMGPHSMCTKGPVPARSQGIRIVQCTHRPASGGAPIAAAACRSPARRSAVQQVRRPRLCRSLYMRSRRAARPGGRRPASPACRRAAAIDRRPPRSPPRAAGPPPQPELLFIPATMEFLADIGRMNKRQFLLQTINLGARGPGRGRRLLRSRFRLPPPLPAVLPALSLTLIDASAPGRHDHHQRADDLEVAGAGHRQRVAGECCRSRPLRASLCLPAAAVLGTRCTAASRRMPPPAVAPGAAAALAAQPGSQLPLFARR